MLHNQPLHLTKSSGRSASLLADLILDDVASVLPLLFAGELFHYMHSASPESLGQLGDEVA